MVSRIIKKNWDVLDRRNARVRRNLIGDKQVEWGGGGRGPSQRGGISNMKQNEMKVKKRYTESKAKGKKHSLEKRPLRK